MDIPEQLREQGYICRDAFNECDLPEVCTGESGSCPQDVFKKNGSPCGAGTSGVDKSTGESSYGQPFSLDTYYGSPTGYCFNGICPTLNMQCERIWGYGGSAADKQCYEQFNSKGSINGHCGTDQGGNYLKCEPE